MSARVYIRIDLDEPLTADSFAVRAVPDANHAVITEEGHLRLWSSQDYNRSDCGLFKDWDHVVIEPRALRGRDGRFIGKETR